MESQLDTAKPSLYLQETDFELIELLATFIQNKTFIDVGAEKGSFTNFLASKGMTGCFFEPLSLFDDELKNIESKTGCRFFPYAVDEKDGTCDFYTAFDHSDHQLNYFSSMHPLKNDKRINHKKIHKVVCRSLDSLAKEGLLESSYGIIKIDTEGNDLNVLKGMKNIQAEALMCEFFMPGIYAGWELGHPVGLIEEAKKLGYNNYLAIKRIDEYEKIDLNNSNFIEQQWGNLIFMKDELFKSAEEKINAIIKLKEEYFLKHVFKTTANFRRMIEELNNACEERLKVINEYKLLHDTKLKKVTESTLAKAKTWISANILKKDISN